MLARLHVARLALLEALPIRGLQNLVIEYAHPFRGKIVHRLPQANTTCFVAVSHQLIATCTDDDRLTVRVWNIETSQIVRTHTVGQEIYYLVSENGRLAAHSLGQVHVWDDCASDQAPVIINTGDTSFAMVALSKSKWLAFRARSIDFSIWDTKTCTRTCDVHSDDITDMLFLEDGTFATASETTVFLWDPETGALINKLEGHSDLVSKLCLLPNGLLAVGCNDRSVRVWDPSTGSLLQELEPESARPDNSKPVWQLLALPQGKIAMSVCHEGLIVWDVPSGKVVREMARSALQRPFWVLLDDGDLLECSSLEVVVWDVSRNLQALVVKEGVIYGQVVCGNRLVTDSIYCLTVWE